MFRFPVLFVSGTKGNVNPTGENSSFNFTVAVKSVPLYRFKLANVVLYMAVREFFETHF